MTEKFTGWQTPSRLFDRLNLAVGGFAVDAAATEDNALVPSYYGPGSELGEDALVISEWLNPAWCNPPYGKGLTKWLEKFLEQAALGVSVVALLPAHTEGRYWHDLIVRPGCDVLFLVGRVPFERPGEDGLTKVGSKPRDASALVIYGPLTQGQIGWLDWTKEEEEKSPAE